MTIFHDHVNAVSTGFSGGVGVRAQRSIEGEGERGRLGEKERERGRKRTSSRHNLSTAGSKSVRKIASDTSIHEAIADRTTSARRNGHRLLTGLKE